MANAPAIPRKRIITTTDNGAELELGDTGAEATPGVWCLQFVPGAAWAGSLAILGRITGPFATTDGVADVALPYRKIYFNGAVADWSFAPAGTLLTDFSIVQVPAHGLLVNVLVSCTAGSGTLYSWPLVGIGTP